ncbi:hypothetical protein QAD02_005531 [Eretmocerus hayati]|uniref:Uncharacterized protein n=1 Tax=Eretmocerus hayati TaxID=131215 RepID=A0ACC2NVD6_9HYME|nr:hypothetical protein QAD02_005531 [Eretmocerus hayati]
MAPSRKPRGRPAVLNCNKHDSGDCHRISTRSHPALHSDCDKVAIGKRNGKAKHGPKPQPAARSTRRKDPKVEATRGTKRRPHSEEQNDSTRRLRRRRFRSPTPYSWDRVSPDSTFANSLLNDEPNLMLDSDSSADEDDENQTHRSGKGKGIRQQGGAARRHQMQIARSLQLVSSTSELLNQQPTTQADRNLLQRIHQYLSDGIAEGRRRAQRYVRKALLFALDMGYLSFADREGKLLRVSPDLKPVQNQLCQRHLQAQNQHRENEIAEQPGYIVGVIQEQQVLAVRKGPIGGHHQRIKEVEAELGQ